MQVRVPGSSANMGSGFDVIGMALSVYAQLGLVDGATESHQHRVEGRHPAHLAYRAAGGRDALWVRSSIPSGRGLGFSGAVRVAAVALGLAERAGVIGGELDAFIEERRDEILNLSAEMEGHADNVAASLHGGVVACMESGGRVRATEIPLATALVSDTHIVVWIPHEQTATAESRASLSSEVSRSDAVFNIARVAQLVLALGSDNRDLLAAGVEDRLHQEHRLDKVPNSRRALEAMRKAGSIACWLSGSGPTAAALVGSQDLEAVEAVLGSDDFLEMGRSMRLTIDVGGLQAAR